MRTNRQTAEAILIGARLKKLVTSSNISALHTSFEKVVKIQLKQNCKNDVPRTKLNSKCFPKFGEPTTGGTGKDLKGYLLTYSMEQSPS
jgi:hypothetical protein